MGQKHVYRLYLNFKIKWDTMGNQCASESNTYFKKQHFKLMLRKLIMCVSIINTCIYFYYKLMCVRRIVIVECMQNPKQNNRRAAYVRQRQRPQQSQQHENANSTTDGAVLRMRQNFSFHLFFFHIRMYCLRILCALTPAYVCHIHSMCIQIELNCLMEIVVRIHCSL